MNIIETAPDVNDLAAKEPNTGGLYFVTAFSGLLAPYWDSGAAGMLIGSYIFLRKYPIAHCNYQVYLNTRILPTLPALRSRRMHSKRVPSSRA